MAREIDVAGAAAALEAAGGMPDVIPSTGQDPFNRNAQGQFASSTPAEDATPVAEATPETPDVPETTQETETSDEPSFTDIPDDVLTPEQLQMKRSLQADYTRKQQEAAPWRKLAEEFNAQTPDDLREAMQLYSKLSDPRNWPGFHAELTEYMTQMGMSPAAAAQVASDQLAEFAPETAVEEYGEDPRYSRLEQELRSLKETIQTQQAQSQQEREWQQVAEALTKQELQIRSDNPSYTDTDIEFIYNLTGQDGDLLKAQAQYESMIGRRVAAYIQTKTNAHEVQPTPVAGGGVIPDESANRPLTLDEGHARAMAHIAQLDREEAQGG